MAEHRIIHNWIFSPSREVECKAEKYLLRVFFFLYENGRHNEIRLYLHTAERNKTFFFLV